jgi:perosamine synthetase
MIPVFTPCLRLEETELVRQCLQSGWISSTGAFIDSFEQQWAAYCGRKHGIAVSSGTAALHIAVRLLNLQEGDEIIMPTFTIISCAQAVTQCGGIPVLVDSHPVNWQMDVSQIEARITPRTRAIMVVHIYGHPADMDAVMDIARRHRLAVIEDAAEVHGAEYREKRCGSFGDTSIFSFYANKLVTTGEGGMILTDDDDLAARARSLRNLCFEKSQRFLHREIGFNYRLTNLQAAVGVAQIGRIAETIRKKRAIAAAYRDKLQDIPKLIHPIEEPWARSVYWVYGLILAKESNIDAVEFSRRLYEKGIETRPFFLGMHEQPAFIGMGLFSGERYPVAERFSRYGLYVPSGPDIREEEIDEICSAIRKCVA